MSERNGRNRVPGVLIAGLAVVVVAMLATLVLRLQPSSADARVYHQVTQPPPTIAVPSVAFIGDSYSAGTGSSGFNSRFTTLVSAYEGWSQESFAHGGTGYLRVGEKNKLTGCAAARCPSYSQVIDAVKSADPNIIVVSGGRNDIGLDEASVQQAIASFYSRLRQAVPKAKIIVSSPLWAYTAPPAQLDEITRTVRAEAASIDATFIDLGEPLVQDRSLVSSDRVHPNDRGHAEIARLFEVALSQTLASGASNPTPSND